MLTGAGRIGPFLAISLAVHGLVLLTTDTQRLSIAATPAGEGRTVSVRLLAARHPDTDADPHGSDHARVPEPEPGQSTQAARGRAPSMETFDASARPVPATPSASQRAAHTAASGKSEASEATMPEAQIADGTEPETPSSERTRASRREDEAPAEERGKPSKTLARQTDGDHRPRSPDRPGETGPAAKPERAASAEEPTHATTAPKAAAAPRSPDRQGEAGSASASAQAERVRASVAAQLAKYFRYPRLARSRGWEGQVVLTFRVHPDGHLSHIRIRESSGRALLDDAAIEALESVRRVPGLRNSNLERTVSLTLPVTYRLQAA